MVHGSELKGAKSHSPSCKHTIIAQLNIEGVTN